MTEGRFGGLCGCASATEVMIVMVSVIDQVRFMRVMYSRWHDGGNRTGGRKRVGRV